VNLHKNHHFLQKKGQKRHIFNHFHETFLDKIRPNL
jgi:hypothetical protein